MSVTTDQTPRTTLELREAELRYLVAVLAETRTDDPRAGGDSLYEKARQLLAIETGAGGRFVDPA